MKRTVVFRDDSLNEICINVEFYGTLSLTIKSYGDNENQHRKVSFNKPDAQKLIQYLNTLLSEM